jgi:hypothetical protein
LLGSLGIQAQFIDLSATKTTYDDGVTEWDVINVYANFSDDTWQVLNVFSADISASDGLGFSHNDLNDGNGGSWQPSFSFEIAPVYDPLRDSYVTIGYGVGLLAAINSTMVDPAFDPSTGPDVPLDAGWYNSDPLEEQFAIGGQVHVGQFVMDASRSADFTFEAHLGFNQGLGTGTNFGDGVVVVEGDSEVIEEDEMFLDVFNVGNKSYKSIDYKGLMEALDLLDPGASDGGIQSETANGKQFDTYDYDMMMDLLEQLNE